MSTVWREKMKKPKVLSLFAGIGGFDLGFERAGFEVVGHVEIDKWCRQVLREKWPNALCLEDVRKVTGKEVLKELGVAPDVITFRFP